jgi:hypothetical protein
MLVLVVQVFVLLLNMSKFVLVGNNVVLQIENNKFDICETENIFWFECENATEVQVGYIFNPATSQFLYPLTLEELQAQKIVETNNYASVIIIKEYPLWRQSNISLGIESGKEEMVAYIEKYIACANNLVSIIEATTTITELRAIDVYNDIYWN